MTDIFIHYLSSRLAEEEEACGLYSRIEGGDQMRKNPVTAIRILRWCRDAFDKNRSVFDQFDTKYDFFQCIDVDDSHGKFCIDLCNEIWDNLKAAQSKI